MNRYNCMYLMCFLLLCSGVGSAATEMTVDMPPQDYFALPDYHPARVREVSSEMDALWDTIFAYNTTSLTGSVYIVGAEFDGSSFWVSSGISYKYLYQINRAFTTVLNTITQLCSHSSWGWRDMAYDSVNNYLYTGCETTGSYDMVRIDLNVNPPTITDLNAPSIGALQNCIRGMAFDPATGHLWISNWYSGLYEITPEGLLVFSDEDSELTAIIKYGLCWDNVNAGGPYIWITEEDWSGGYVYQYSVTSQSLTGESRFLGLFAGNTSGIPGGIFLDELGELNPGYATFGGIQQGDNDIVFGLEFPQISTPTPSPTATASPTPTVTPTPTPTGTPPPLPVLGSAGILLLLLAMSGMLVVRHRH